MPERGVLITQAADALRARFDALDTWVNVDPDRLAAEAVLDAVEALIREDERTHIQAHIEALRWPDTGVIGAYTHERACENEMLDRALAALRVVGEATPCDPTGGRS